MVDERQEIREEGNDAQVVQVVAVDDVQYVVDAAVSDALARYGEGVQPPTDYATTADVQAVALSLSHDISGVKSDVKALADSKSDASEVVVVTLDSQQWETVQRCWGWAKAGAQVGLYVELVLLLVVCAMLGNRLWDAFSKGWRS